MPREYPPLIPEEPKETVADTSNTVVDTGPAPTLIPDSDNARFIDAEEAKEIRNVIEAITREEYVREHLERKLRKLEELWPGTSLGETPHNVMKQGRGGNCYAISALEAIKRNKRAFDVLVENINKTLGGDWRLWLYDADTNSSDFIDLNVEQLEKDAEHSMLEGNLGDKIFERASQSLTSRKRRIQEGDKNPEGKTMEVVLERGNKKMWESGLPHKALSEFLGPKYQKFLAVDQSAMVEALHEIDTDRKLPADQQKVLATAFTQKEWEETPEKKSRWKFWKRPKEHTNPAEKIFPKHAYTVVGVDREYGNVTLINPHDTSFTFQISFKDFFKKFKAISYVKEMEDRKDVKAATVSVG